MIKKKTVYNFFKFLEDKRGEKMPFKYKFYHFPQKVDKEEVRKKVGDLKFKLLYEPNKLTEEDLHVKGDLLLRDLPITELPNNLIVDGDLTIISTKIKKLPDDIKVGLDLFVSHTPLEHLPDNLQTILLGCNHTNIKDVPLNLRVEQSFYCIGTPLAEKYTEEEIKKMIEDKGGYVKNRVKTEWG